jgi:menaquinone-dependent protoporphyrinogen oxidase
MARILVIYATQYGQACRIAQAMGDTLQESGHIVDVVEASDAAPRPEGYDGIIVTGSVHVGGYQRNLRRWVRTHADTLAAKPAAFVSVCLAVLQHDAAVERELASIRERFEASTGWHPRIVKIVAGSLLYTRYNWLTRYMMRRIVAKAGGDTDTSRDYEYTDWVGLRAFAREFVATLAGSQEVRGSEGPRVRGSALAPGQESGFIRLRQGYGGKGESGLSGNQG